MICVDDEIGYDAGRFIQEMDLDYHEVWSDVPEGCHRPLTDNFARFFVRGEHLPPPMDDAKQRDRDIKTAAAFRRRIDGLAKTHVCAVCSRYRSRASISWAGWEQRYRWWQLLRLDLPRTSAFPGVAMLDSWDLMDVSMRSWIPQLSLIKVG